MEAPSLCREAANAAQQPRLKDLLAGIILRPEQLILYWNWKAALLSITLRGPIFFTAALQKGWGAALVQILKDATPQWLTVTLLTVVFPGILQAVEYILHGLRGTPHLHAAAAISLCVGAMATLFNWFAMRRGVMLVGEESGGLWSDLRRMPIVFFNFVAALPRWIAQRTMLVDGR